MAKHKPNAVWCTTLNFDKPHYVVSTDSPKTLRIVAFDGVSSTGTGFRISRRQARILAKRITACLEETR